MGYRRCTLCFCLVFDGVVDLATVERTVSFRAFTLHFKNLQIDRRRGSGAACGGAEIEEAEGDSE
jgi:hypothetical protein